MRLRGGGGLGDRNTDEWHRLQWEQAEDEIGRQMLALFRDANALRKRFPALRRGGVSILHEVCMSFVSLSAPSCDRQQVFFPCVWGASGAVCCFFTRISVLESVCTGMCSPQMSGVVLGWQKCWRGSNGAVTFARTESWLSRAQRAQSTR